MRRSKIALFVILGLLVFPACRLVSETVDVEATVAAAVAATANVQPQPSATSIPSTTQTLPPNASPPPFEIDTSIYQHPVGFCKFNPPLGWTVQEDPKGSVMFISPQKNAFFYVEATNTGVELDAEGLEAFVTAREQNVFGTMPDYVQTYMSANYAEEFAWIEKEFTFTDGLPWYVATSYTSIGKGAVFMEAWMQRQIKETYDPQFQRIMETISFHNTGIDELPLYNWSYTFTDRYELYSIIIPESWPHSTALFDDDFYADIFTSPDEKAVIINITDDEDAPYSSSQAEELALTLLNDLFTGEADDIRVTADNMQPNGSQRLEWITRNGGTQGISYIETRGKTFFMFTAAH